MHRFLGVWVSWPVGIERVYLVSGVVVGFVGGLREVLVLQSSLGTSFDFAPVVAPVH